MAEAFAQGIARGDDLRSPAAWVWKAAFAIARGELASRQRTDVSPSAIAPVIEIEEVLDVVKALRSLSPMQRSAVVLHHFAGYSLRDVAALLGSSRSAIGVHLFARGTSFAVP